MKHQSSKPCATTGTGITEQIRIVCDRRPVQRLPNTTDIALNISKRVDIDVVEQVVLRHQAFSLHLRLLETFACNAGYGYSYTAAHGTIRFPFAL